MKLKNAITHPVQLEADSGSAKATDPHEDDQITYRAIKAGDRKAFTVMYDKYWYRLFLVAHRRLHHKAVSEELVQNIFVRLWNKRETVQILHLENYLFTSIRYEVISYIRAQVVEEKYAEYYQAYMPTEVSQAEESLALEELNKAVESGLNTLPEKSRQIFKLSRFENLTIPQIAHQLHLSEKAVEYHLTKSLKFFRSYLKEFFVLFVLWFK